MFSVHHLESISIALLLVEIWIRWIYKICTHMHDNFNTVLSHRWAQPGCSLQGLPWCRSTHDSGRLWSPDLPWWWLPPCPPHMPPNMGVAHNGEEEEGERSCTTQCRVYKLLGWCHKQSRENPDLSNIDMQEAPDFLLPIEFSGSFLHLSDDGHLTVELQQVLPR